MAKVKVGMVQMSCSNVKQDKLSKAMQGIRNAAAQGAQIVCLQELFTSLYFCDVEDYENFKLAEAIPGATTNALSELAAELNVVIIASLFEKRTQGLYHNTTAVIDADGTYLGKYRKMHIPDDPAYYEKFYFTPGDLGFHPIDTSIGRLGVLVCWDQWYPEAARLMALTGAELLVYPTAIGWDPDDTEEEKARQRQAWLLSHRGHAVANGIPVLSCNRTGFEPSPIGASGIRFWGSSHVLGPQGEYLAEAGTDAPEILVADIDLARSESVRRRWPFLRDPRIDAYADLLKRYRD